VLLPTQSRTPDGTIVTCSCEQFTAAPVGFYAAVVNEGHIPVLLREVLELLAPAPGDVYVDCTAGRGGHAAEIAPRLSPGGRVVLNDLDAANLVYARERITRATEQAQPPAPVVTVVRGNYASLPRTLVEAQIRADVVLADLGFSSNQVDDSARGFSFARDGPLDMRLDPTSPVSAADLVASLSETELASTIRDLGEERHATLVARKLVQARREQPITTTRQLALLVRSALGSRGDASGIDPATRTFQALRIAVNDEIGSLEAFLAEIDRGARGAAKGSPTWLAPGARIAVISFHSLEDRPVKRAFEKMAEDGVGDVLTRSPIRASEDETRINGRSRSAKMRVVRVVSAQSRAESV